MALWGDKDNIYSGGTVSLDYQTGVVTGSGTTFGNVGAAGIGDVIRFGDVVGGTYYGDAVIVDIASTTQLTIGSTAGLSGATISGAQFTVNQEPKYTIDDVFYSQKYEGSGETINAVVTTASAPGASIGTSIVAVASTTGILVTDTLTASGGVSAVVSSIGATTVSLGSTISAGISTGATITFTRVCGARNTYIAGVSTEGVGAAASTAYEVTHGGWVGVTTYKDSEGNLRVKKEILVAMSGIQTGNVPIYDEDPTV
jgi:hypothetical protein